MDEETKIMLEVQTKMLDLIAQYPPEHTEPVIAMCFKLILDCYNSLDPWLCESIRKRYGTSLACLVMDIGV